MTARVLALLPALASLAAAAPAPAGPLPAHARWQVVAVEGRHLPRHLHLSEAELTLVRHADGRLVPVPFQIDERDGAGRLVLPSGPAAAADESPLVLDDDDLLVFAARDAGERAEVPDAAEIRVTDPPSGRSGWVYLRAGSTRPPAAAPDVRYAAERDTVYGRRYVVGFGPHTPTLFAFRDRDGRETPNLLDRVKVRATASVLWGLLAFRRTEEDLGSTVLAWKSGPVRAVRRARLTIRLGYGLPAPSLVAEDVFTRDTFEGPVVVRLPFDLRYVFGDLTVGIFLDFADLEGYRVFGAGFPPTPLACDEAPPGGTDVKADWFGMTGPGGTFVHALVVSPTMASVERRLRLVASPEPDPPERVPGNCPGAGYTLAHWAGIGRGTHRMGMVVHAFDGYRPGAARAFVESIQSPLAVTVTPPGPSRADP